MVKLQNNVNSTAEIVYFILHDFYHNLKKHFKKVFEIESVLSSRWEGGTYVVTDYQMFNIKHRHFYWLIIGQVLRISSRMLWNIILHEASLRCAAEQQWNESGMDLIPCLSYGLIVLVQRDLGKRRKRGAGDKRLLASLPPTGSLTLCLKSMSHSEHNPDVRWFPSNTHQRQAWDLRYHRESLSKLLIHILPDTLSSSRQITRW